MLPMIESLESRALFSISPVVATEVRDFRLRGTELKADLVASKKDSDANYLALVVSLKDAGVYKADESLLATLRTDSAMDRVQLDKDTAQFVGELDTAVSNVVSTAANLQSHLSSKNSSAYLAKYSAASTRYSDVEGSFASTLEAARDQLGTADVTNLQAIASANPNVSLLQDTINTIESNSSTGESNFAQAVTEEADAAAVVVSDFKS